MNKRSGKKFDIESYHENPKVFERNISYIRKNTDWYPKKIKTHILMMLAQTISAMGGVGTRSPEGFRVSVTIFKDDYLLWSYDPRDFRRIGNFLIHQSERNPVWIDRYVRDFRRASNKFTHVAEQVQFGLLPKSRQSLRELVTRLFNSHLGAQSYGYITESATATLRDYWVTDYILQIAPHLTPEEVNILLRPSEASFLKKFQDALRRSHSNKALARILRHYYWIKGSYWEQPTLTLAQLRIEKKKLGTFQLKQIPNKSRIIARAPRRRQLAHFVHLVEMLITLQDERKENAMRMNCALRRIADHLQMLFPGWAASDLLGLTPEEFLRFMDGGMADAHKKLVRQRRKKSGWVFTSAGYTLRTDHRAVQAMTRILKLQSSRVIKGFTASPGVVSGRVKVILSENDFGKMKQGDILITAMTRPEFMPVLRKAAAFVTDEGGITCHAAIISREMGKPCIIGTKTATSVLLDGDRVEVNATKGVVRKL